MLENNQPDSTFREGKVEQNAHQLILHSSVSSFSRVVFEKLYSSRWTIKGFTCLLYRHQASYMNFIKDLIDLIKAIKIKQQISHASWLETNSAPTLANSINNLHLRSLWISKNDRIFNSTFPSLNVMYPLPGFVVSHSTGRAGRSGVYFHLIPVSLCPGDCSVGVHRHWR